MSYASRQDATCSSARAVTISASTESCGSTSASQFIRLPSESSSVSRIDGSAILSGTPGKPAPQPTSITLLPRKSAAPSSAMQSRKCSSATADGSVMAVRFMTSFFSISACPKRQSVSTCASESAAGDAGRPARSVFFTEQPPNFKISGKPGAAFSNANPALRFAFERLSKDLLTSASGKPKLPAYYIGFSASSQRLSLPFPR